jgi:hypothetical protein
VCSEDVLAETIYSYRRSYPHAPGSLITSIRRLLTDNLDDLVGDFEVNGTFTGNDQYDAHVHAAALACGADILLTDDHGFANVCGGQSTPHYGYEVFRADEFFLLVDDSNPEAVRTVTQQQIAYWMAKKGEVNLPESLRCAGCPGFAERVRQRQLEVVK